MGDLPRRLAPQLLQRGRYPLTPAALSALNAFTGECSELWVLHANSCPSEGAATCRAVATTSTFDNTRECLSQPDKAAEAFEKLRASFVSQADLMKTLIRNFAGLTSDTAHTKVGLG